MGKVELTMKDRILIATNEPMLAKGLETTLLAGGLGVCGICSDVFELFDSLLRLRPDIVILDMPVLPTPGAVTELRLLAPRCQFVVWPRTIARAGTDEAIRSGARGVLPADASPARLAEVLRLIVNFPEPDGGVSDLVNLTCTPLERQCLAMAGHGLNNQEIAAAVNADESTVHRLLCNVSDRLGAGDRYELALYGLSTIAASNSNQGGPFHG
jgi:DNA-binding NarL/FixJ family response regulator